MKILIKPFLTLLPLFVVGTASSATLLYDGFHDYTVGTTLNGANGGSGWGSNSWVSNTSTDSISATGLTYTNGGTLTVSAQSFTDASIGGSRFANRLDGLTIADGTSYWGSFLIETTSANLTSAPAFALRTSAGTVRAGIYTDASGNWTLGTRDAGGDPTPGNNNGGLNTIAASGTQLVVFRIDAIAAANDNFHAWINPVIGGSAPLVSDSAYLGGSTGLDAFATTANLAQVAFDLGGVNTNTGRIDEFRFGTTFADVTPVPEPTSWALLAGGLTGLVVFRRHRSE